MFQHDTVSHKNIDHPFLQPPSIWICKIKYFNLYWLKQKKLLYIKLTHFLMAVSVCFNIFSSVFLKFFLLSHRFRVKNLPLGSLHTKQHFCVKRDQNNFPSKIHCSTKIKLTELNLNEDFVNVLYWMLLEPFTLLFQFHISFWLWKTRFA